MTATVCVRPAEKDDLGAVIAIERACFSEPWRIETFAAMLGRPDTDVLVATVAGVVVGYLVLTSGSVEAELANLAVSPAHRGSGVGEALLGRSLEILRRREARRMYLAVRASNVRAARLYERFGFREIGSHQSYYQQPPEDARIFALEIPPAPLPD